MRKLLEKIFVDLGQPYVHMSNFTEDNEITCFAPGKPLASGRERILQAIENRHEDVSRDPFILNHSDIENNPANEVDEDSGTDEDVEII